MIVWTRNKVGPIAGWRFLGGMWSETGIGTTAISVAAGVVYTTVTGRRLSVSATDRPLSVSATPERVSVSVTTKGY